MNKVIAISGFPGSGKSTLMYELSRRVSGACLDYDRYQRVTDRPIEEITRWLRDGADYNELVVPGLAEDLRRLKSGMQVTERGTGREVPARQYIFLETPLGREHRPTSQFIDVVLWLDVPLDVALARNIRAFTSNFLNHETGSEYSNDLMWLESYLTNYIEHVREMLLLQYEKIGKTADVIVNACGRADAVLIEALSRLNLPQA
jgi:uridine kinase